MKRATLERWIIKPAVFAVALIPAIALTVAALQGNLGANPVERLTHESGEWGLRFLLLTLALTPLRQVSGWTLAIRLRRMLGLFGFFYVAAHFAIYLVLDQFFAWGDIVEDIIERPYITVGFLGLVTLIPLAVTSTNGMIRRFGAKRWKLLHRLAYVAVGAGIVHFLWLVKADLREPLVYGAIFVALMAFRIPAVRNAVNTTRSRFRQPAA